MDIIGNITKAAADATKGLGDAAAAAGKGIADAASVAGKGVKDAANTAGKGVTDVANAAGKGVADAANAAGEAIGGAADAVKKAIPGGDNSPISETQIRELLDLCYEKSLNGIPSVSKSVDELANDYLSKYDDVNDAARSLINMQLIKNTTSGALSGLTGVLALPVALAAIPANISNVLYVQMRMVAALAKMGGYDLKSDQVQTMIYVCMTGSAAGDLFKDAGVKVAGKLAKGAIEKIPGTVCTKINQAVGFRLVTKFGQTGVVNLGKLVPVAGAVVGGAFDFTSTRVIANVAYERFIGDAKGDVVDDETVRIIESNAQSQCE